MSIVVPMCLSEKSNSREINLTEKELRLFILENFYRKLFEKSKDPTSAYYTEEQRFRGMESLLTSIQNIITDETNRIEYQEEEVNNVTELKYRRVNGIGEKEIDQQYNAYCDQSNSFENIMDYEHNASGALKDGFLYKIFYYWQWKKMWNFTNYK